MEEFERELETMLAAQAGISIVLAAIIATHPEYEKLQLKLSALLEHAAPKTLWPILDERQRGLATAYVEFLQRIAEDSGKTDPLSQLGLQWKPSGRG